MKIGFCEWLFRISQDIFNWEDLFKEKGGKKVIIPFSLPILLWYFRKLSHSADHIFGIYPLIKFFFSNIS